MPHRANKPMMVPFGLGRTRRPIAASTSVTLRYTIINIVIVMSTNDGDGSSSALPCPALVGGSRRVAFRSGFPGGADPVPRPLHPSQRYRTPTTSRRTASHRV